MKNIIYIGVLLQIGWSYGESQGVGSYSYTDSTGRRYGGTYDLQDGQVVGLKGNFPPNFSPPTFPDFDEFFPEYFRNLGNLLEDSGFTSTVTTTNTLDSSETGRSFFKPLKFPKFPKLHFGREFKSNIDNQKRAFSAARKAFDLTSNQAGFNGAGFEQNPYGFRGYQPFPDYTGYDDFAEVPHVPRLPALQPLRPFTMPPFPSGPNSAMASGLLTSGYSSQTAAISPPNPNNPNVQVSHFSDDIGTGPGYHSVSVSSYSSSSDIDGVKSDTRKASTIIDDNGKVTRYDVSN